MLGIPEPVRMVIQRMEDAGYEAYAVGGCVRDSLMGQQPHDWDICTSALPEQTKKCFPDFRTIDTGLRHGTVTLLIDHIPYEVTTYRTDGTYSDRRHPDEVRFVDSLREDLSRRDFTVNAMAYSPSAGLADPFSGQGDLKARVIRCVGNPDERFHEDALRIMRALRFASVLQFQIEPATASSLHRNKHLLCHIAAERIQSELCRLLTGVGAGAILNEYADIFCEILPELSALPGFQQQHPYHSWDVWEHTWKAVEASPPDFIVRLTMLLHDIGKPFCFTQDENGIGHFYGHGKKSAEIAEAVMKRLRFDNQAVSTVHDLVFYHDNEIEPRRKHVKRWLNRLGGKNFRLLLEVKRSDIIAQAPQYREERLGKLSVIQQLTEQVIQERQCFCLRDLAVNGRDLLQAGVPKGIQVGIILNHLMDMVIEEEIENDRRKLIAAVQSYLHS